MPLLNEQAIRTPRIATETVAIFEQNVDQYQPQCHTPSRERAAGLHVAAVPGGRDVARGQRLDHDTHLFREMDASGAAGTAACGATVLPDDIPQLQRLRRARLVAREAEPVRRPRRVRCEVNLPPILVLILPFFPFYEDLLKS